MPDMISQIVFAAWFAGGFVSGVTGIGGAMVAVPVAAFFIPMHEVILLSCILNAVMDCSIASLHFRHCRVSALWPMLTGALPGCFAGLYILQLLSGAVLQGAVGLLLLVYVYWQYSARAGGPGTHPRAAGITAGFGAGLLGTAISFDGPPAGAYALYMGWSPRVLLGTLGIFFLIRSSFTCVLQASAGLYSSEVLGYAMYGIPACILGTLLAFPVTKRIHVETFHRLLMIVIALAGVVCLFRSF